MKTKLSLSLLALGISLASYAGDVKTVVFKTKPEMHCANCENKIKSNLRFEKGVKEIKTDLKTKEVTVKYDSDKTNVEKLIAGFGKINYEATAQNNPEKEEQKEQRKEAKKAEKKEKKRTEKQAPQKESQHDDHEVDGASGATSK